MKDYPIFHRRPNILLERREFLTSSDAFVIEKWMNRTEMYRCVNREYTGNSSYKQEWRIGIESRGEYRTPYLMSIYSKNGNTPSYVQATLQEGSLHLDLGTLQLTKDALFPVPCHSALIQNNLLQSASIKTEQGVCHLVWNEEKGYYTISPSPTVMEYLRQYNLDNSVLHSLVDFDGENEAFMSSLSIDGNAYNLKLPIVYDRSTAVLTTALLNSEKLLYQPASVSPLDRLGAWFIEE